MVYLVIVFWIASVILAMVEYAELCGELNIAAKLFIGILFLIGGPIFLVANALEDLIEIIAQGDVDDDHFGSI